jgi:hypothetical protein
MNDIYIASIMAGLTIGGLGKGLIVKPVHYGLEIRHVEYRDWYDEDGDHHYGGGYDKPYRIVKKPMYGRDIDIAGDFTLHLRDEFTPENERKAVPMCRIWRDNLNTWWNDRSSAR